MSTFTGTIATISAGDEILDSDLDTWHDALVAAAGAWTPYTPTLTNVTLGNGTLTGKYRQVGKTVDFSISLTFGTTTAFTGSIGFGLPVTAVDVNWTAAGFLFDSSNSEARQGAIVNPSTTVALLYAAGMGPGATSSGPVDATNPFTWASPDLVRISGTYEAA